MKKEDLPVYKNNEELPLVLSTNDVAGYELMRSKNFPSIQIKRCYKIQREQFLQWINQTTGKVL